MDEDTTTHPTTQPIIEDKIDKIWKIKELEDGVAQKNQTIVELEGEKVGK